MWKVIVFCLIFSPIFCSDLKKIQPHNSKTQDLWDLIWQDEVDAKRVEELLAQGADATERLFDFGAIEQGWDMLSAAILQAHFHIIPSLLNYGASVHKTLFPPVGFIASLVHGRVGCCKISRKESEHQDYCFFARAKKNYPDQVSFKAAYIDVLTCLVKNGADIDARFDDLPTAYQMAHERGHEDICRILQKAGREN